MLAPGCPGVTVVGLGADATIANDEGCTPALITCADPDEYRYFVFTHPQDPATGQLVQPPQPWTLSGHRCVAPAEVNQGGVTPAMVLEEFKRLPLPQGQVIVQPGDRTLVNFPTVFYTELAGDQVLRPVTILGQQVEIIAEPRSYAWDFGDGQSMTTETPGAPYPAKEITHEYATNGDVQATLTVTYGGRFRVAGGAWLPIPGTTTVTSAPTAVSVLEARSQLIAGND